MCELQKIMVEIKIFHYMSHSNGEISNFSTYILHKYACIEQQDWPCGLTVLSGPRLTCPPLIYPSLAICGQWGRHIKNNQSPDLKEYRYNTKTEFPCRQVVVYKWMFSSSTAGNHPIYTNKTLGDFTGCMKAQNALFLRRLNAVNRWQYNCKPIWVNQKHRK